jgi:sugar phosphate isomerase/epimerase
MKLGFLTAPFPQTPLMEVADWAASAGFEVLEIACWPVATGPTRRYAGTSHIDVANLSASQATEIVDQIAGKGLSGCIGSWIVRNLVHEEVPVFE